MTDNDCPAVVRNFARAKTVGRRMSWILSREGATPWVSGSFFKAVIQAVLLFGEETWVVTPQMGTALGGVQTQVVRLLTGQLPWRARNRTWKYTSEAAAMEAEVFMTIEEYVRRRHYTVAHYIATRSLLDLCEGQERAPGARFRMRWW